MFPRSFWERVSTLFFLITVYSAAAIWSRRALSRAKVDRYVPETHAVNLRIVPERALVDGLGVEAIDVGGDLLKEAVHCFECPRPGSRFGCGGSGVTFQVL